MKTRNGNVEEGGDKARGRVLPYCPVYLERVNNDQCSVIRKVYRRLTVIVKTTRRTIPADLAIYVRTPFFETDFG